MSENIIIVENLNKKFCRSLKRSMFYGTTDVVRDMVGIPYKVKKLRKSEFWALKDINFEIKKGEKIGFLGVNGSGKSTLLRLLNGIFPPDRGKITINGRIGALIAVGAGFHPLMTGRENIYLNGTILGMTRREIEKKFLEIVDFAEIGDFIDAPVATYSSGMTVRLGFSIAVHGNVDIMLVDEILAVGDLAFQLKCQKKLSEFRQQGGTFIIVSHNMQVIRNTCDRVLWLEKGNILANGDVYKICNEYENHSLSMPCNQDTRESLTCLNYDKTTSFTVSILNKNNEICSRILCGEELKIRINFHFERLIANPIFTISALSNDGVIAFENYSFNDICNLQGNGEIDFIIPSFASKPQIYHISVTLAENEILNKLEWHNNLYSILVLKNEEIKINQGFSYFYPSWILKTTSNI